MAVRPARQTSVRSGLVVQFRTGKLAFLLVAGCGTAHAQQGAAGIEGRTSPQRAEPVAPPSVSSQEESELSSLLPKASPPKPAGVLSGGSGILVTKIEVRSAESLSAATIEQIKMRYEGHVLSVVDIVALRNAITDAYLKAGFVNSGAIVNEQDVADGRLVIDVVEGRAVSSLDASSKLNGLNPDYVLKRLWPDPHAVLQRGKLEDNFKSLVSDPNIRNLEVSLRPTSELGLAQLDVRVQAQERVRLTAALATERSPSVGGLRASTKLDVRNIMGWGDTYSLEVGKTEGLFDAIGSMSLPLNADLDAVVRATYSDAHVVEDPLTALDIVSQSETLSAGFDYAWHRTPTSSAVFGAAIERKRSITGLLNQPFSFSPGAVDGVTDITVARITQSFGSQSPGQFFGFRSTLSLGLDGPSHSEVDELVPPKHFSALLLQVQYAAKLPDGFSELSARFDLQYTDAPLVATEQFAFGGINSVRGYRANQVLADRAGVASVEYSYAIGRRLLWDDIGLGGLSVSAFIDGGYGDNANRAIIGKRSLVSVGAALMLHVSDKIDFSYYAAIGAQDASQASTKTLQDRQMGFRLSARL